MQFRQYCCSIPRGESHGLELPSSLAPHIDGELERMLLERILSSPSNRRCAFEVGGNVVLIGGGERDRVECEDLRGGDTEDALVLPPPRMFGDGVAADVLRLLQRIGMLMLMRRWRRLLVRRRTHARRRRRRCGEQEMLGSLHANEEADRVIVRVQRQRPQTPGLLVRRRAATRLIRPQRFPTLFQPRISIEAATPDGSHTQPESYSNLIPKCFIQKVGANPTLRVRVRGGLIDAD